MPETTKERSELYLRCSRRSMAVLLLVIIALGAGALAMTLCPESAVSRAFEKASRFFPIATVIAIAALQAPMGKNRWNPSSPEAKAVMNDEWRLMNLHRAMKVAFIVILATQLPMGWIFGVQLAHLPVLRAVLAMSVSTITLGMGTFVASFLIFDRD